jgi:hypothetical protein
MAQPLGMSAAQFIPSYRAKLGVPSPFKVILSTGAVNVNLYQTSAAGVAWLPEGVQPKSDV